MWFPYQAGHSRVSHRFAVHDFGDGKFHVIAPTRVIDEDAARLRDGDAGRHRVVKLSDGSSSPPCSRSAGTAKAVAAPQVKAAAQTRKEEV